MITTIALRKIRTFSAVFTTAKALLQQYGGVLLKFLGNCLLPVVTLVIVCMHIYLYCTESDKYGLLDWGVYLLVGLSGISSVAIACELLYLHLIPAIPTISLSLLVQQLYKHRFMYIETAIMIYVSALFYTLPMLVIALFLPENTYLNALLILVIGLLLLLSLIPVSFTFIIRTIEDISFFAALKRAFTLLHKHWLSNLLLLSVSMAINFSLLSLPWCIATAIHTLTNLFVSNTVVLFLVSSIYYSTLIITYCIALVFINLIIGIQYFSLVEYQEGQGLFKQMYKIGK